MATEPNDNQPEAKPQPAAAPDNDAIVALIDPRTKYGRGENAVRRGA